MLIAVLFAIILGLGFKRTGPGPISGLLYIFFIIFLFTWAIGSWIEPVHPSHIAYPWLSYLFLGLFIMLLLGVLLPPTKPRNKIVTKNDVDEDIDKETAIGLLSACFSGL